MGTVLTLLVTAIGCVYVANWLIKKGNTLNRQLDVAERLMAEGWSEKEAMIRAGINKRD